MLRVIYQCLYFICHYTVTSSRSLQTNISSNTLCALHHALDRAFFFELGRDKSTPISSSISLFSTIYRRFHNNTMFGSAQPSPSPFGTPSSTPAFGTPSSTPAFGTPSFATPSSTPAFGTPSSTPGFGASSTPAFGSSLFSTPFSSQPQQQQQQQQQTPLFQQQPTSSAFGFQNSLAAPQPSPFSNAQLTTQMANVAPVSFSLADRDVQVFFFLFFFHNPVFSFFLSNFCF